MNPPPPIDFTIPIIAGVVLAVAWLVYQATIFAFLVQFGRTLEAIERHLSGRKKP